MIEHNDIYYLKSVTLKSLSMVEVEGKIDSKQTQKDSNRFPAIQNDRSE